MAPAGVIFCAFCLITQVLCQRQSTVSPVNSTALAGNQTDNASHTVATNTTSSPTGAGAQTQASALCVLIPVAMASCLLHRCC